jgi:hypothetical protein
VEYFNCIYLDAELIDGFWHFEDQNGGLQPFISQTRVKPTTQLSVVRQHPPEKAGHIIYPSRPRKQ